MSLLYMIALVTTVLVFIYLVIALFYPEDFS